MHDQTHGTTIILSVGTGRNREDIAAALVFSIRQNGARRAVFLCSAKTRAETLPVVVGQLGWPEDCYRVHVCADEDNVETLFVEWNQAWDELLAGWRPARVIVDFTSGTKPMSAAAAMLGISRGAEALSYVVGRRDETGRVVESTDVRSLLPALVLAHRRLTLAADHFNAGSFAAARDIAAEYLKITAMPDDRLREVARSVHFIASACEAWDRFDYTQAARHLRDSQRYWNQWQWVMDSARLKAVQQLIHAARDAATGRGALEPALAADLLASAQRCMRRQDWDDAVARLYRACELLAQLKLLRDYGQQTGNIDPEKLPEDLRQQYRDRKSRADGGRLKLGLEQSFTLLEQLADPLGREFRARYGRRDAYGPLNGLLNARNNSLLAHGTTPIGQDKAGQLREHILALADVAEPDICRKWLPMAVLPEFGAF